MKPSLSSSSVAPVQLQPPTCAPAFEKGMQVLPLGHSESSVHITMPVHAEAATQAVPVMERAKSK